MKLTHLDGHVLSQHGVTVEFYENHYKADYEIVVYGPIDRLDFVPKRKVVKIDTHWALVEPFNPSAQDYVDLLNYVGERVERGSASKATAITFEIARQTIQFLKETN